MTAQNFDLDSAFAAAGIDAAVLGSDARDFYAHILQTASEDCPDLMTPADFLLCAQSLWDAGKARAAGETYIDMAAAQTSGLDNTALDVINIITEDKPFLVVSVTGEIAGRAIPVEALFHPIVNINARRVSMMQIITPRQTRRQRSALKDELAAILSDIEHVTEDFADLQAAMANSRAALEKHHGDTPGDMLQESLAFLDWLHGDHFVFLGARTFDFSKITEDSDGRLDVGVAARSSFGLLRDPSVQVLRDASEPTRISPQGRVLFDDPDPVIIAKSNLQSRVHRRVRMDYVSIKIYGPDGTVIGETRFVGLLTAEAYSLPVKDVPLLRAKAENIKARAGLPKGSHAARTLDYVISSYPRDELFQISEDDLLRISTGIVHLLDRPRTRIFVRRDRYDRFVSVLVYVPREQYSTSLRSQIGEHLRKAYGGRISAFYPRYADEPIARVHFIIGVTAFDHAEPDVEDLEAEIASIAAPWDSALDMAAEARADKALLKAVPKYAGGFNAAYRMNFSADEALTDIAAIENLTKSAPVSVRAYTLPDDSERSLRAKFYKREKRLELSDVMPVFGHFGVHVVQETGYKIRRKGQVVWVHDYELRLPFTPEDGAALFDVFETGFMSVLSGQNDDDGFNALILPQSAHWRNIAFLRALCRYRGQSGLDPSTTQQIAALQTHCDIAGDLLDLLDARFNPDRDFKDLNARQESCDNIFSEIQSALTAVKSLDYDRVLRRLANLIMATQRTSFYQIDDKGRPLPRISFKIAPREIENLPEPKPYREIFVWAPHVEGLHLRFGPVARGGLRWSDRRDDYRTEVLGLVKAQQVKNAVIVPVGSKGGFYPKSIAPDADRETRANEGLRAYKSFISGLLDITDNYQGRDIISPERTICYDDPDPYLVVAADKGTATFSDTANSIAIDYGFWLGDAFASGGSVGYDHKKMGITARGAWEAVKRHFRERGKDIQKEPFDVIGVGDMSGDVFGNGMLLSEQICLKAAFNHLDIFIDPDPNPAMSFKERQRMFDLPRSTWQDYDVTLISEGGGVFSRSAKSIELTKQIKDMTGLTADSVTPNELLHALLKSETDLLWFGGIGTYVKSMIESDAAAGDKANDPIRVNGRELGAKVIGEGANLGMTQAGRIEFARAGGAVNTDAIDNSAGVDSSDNEVNIKILLAGAIDAGDLKPGDRNDLLARMTDDVARLVLAHNYDQTQALSIAQSSSPEDSAAWERFMTGLEDRGILNRAVEGLPGTPQMRAYADAGRRAQDASGQKPAGLTRPELAVLLAYSKIALFDDIMAGGGYDDDYFIDMLQSYFPDDLSGYDAAMKTHRLRSEIIGSRLANLLVDVGGALFVSRAQEQTGAKPAAIAQSFMVAYDLLGIDDLRIRISALDNTAPAESQIDLYKEISRVLLRVTTWMLRRREDGTIRERITLRAPGLADMNTDWLKLLSPYDRRRAEARTRQYVKRGIPEDMARDVAMLRSRASGFDVIAFAQSADWPLRPAAELFYDIGGQFKIDRLRNAALAAAPGDHWDALALSRMTEELYVLQGRLARAAASHKDAGPKQTATTVIARWVKGDGINMGEYDRAFNHIADPASGEAAKWTLAKFTLAQALLGQLLER